MLTNAIGLPGKLAFLELCRVATVTPIRSKNLPPKINSIICQSENSLCVPVLKYTYYASSLRGNFAIANCRIEGFNSRKYAAQFLLPRLNLLLTKTTQLHRTITNLIHAYCGADHVRGGRRGVLLVEIQYPPHAKHNRLLTRFFFV